MAKDTLVTDLPIWTDCPFPIHNHLEVRRGKVEDIDLIAIWDPKRQKHVDFSAEGVADGVGAELFEAAQRQLVGN